MYRTRVGNALRRLLPHGNFETSATIRTEDNDVTRWLTAALSEYSSLREESLRALQVQNTIMQFGIAGIAVLIGVALQNSDPILSILILLFLVPLLAIFLVNIWAGELTRVVRASNYISGLEEKINAVIGGEVPALGWEGWLRRIQNFDCTGTIERSSLPSLYSKLLPSLSAATLLSKPTSNFLILLYSRVPSAVLHLHSSYSAYGSFKAI
jgi:hypothetical protein